MTTGQGSVEDRQRIRAASSARDRPGFGAGFCVSFGATPVFIFVWAFSASGFKYWDGLAGTAGYVFLLGEFAVAVCLLFSRRWRWFGLGLVAGLVVAVAGTYLYIAGTEMGRPR